MKRAKTTVAKPADTQRKWFIVDATDKNLGRLSVSIAKQLSGKTTASYTPHVDAGDYVVVINAKNIATTGRKTEEKIYYRHSGYPGGIRSRTLDEQLDKNPEKVILNAVRGMLPKNKLSKGMLSRLRVFAGAEHPHEPQQPKELELN